MSPPGPNEDRRLIQLRAGVSSEIRKSGSGILSSLAAIPSCRSARSTSRQITRRGSFRSSKRSDGMAPDRIPYLRLIDGGRPDRLPIEAWMQAYEAYLRESVNLWFALWWPWSRRG